MSKRQSGSQSKNHTCGIGGSGGDIGRGAEGTSAGMTTRSDAPNGGPLGDGHAAVRDHQTSAFQAVDISNDRLFPNPADPARAERLQKVLNALNPHPQFAELKRQVTMGKITKEAFVERLTILYNSVVPGSRIGVGGQSPFAMPEGDARAGQLQMVINMLAPYPQYAELKRQYSLGQMSKEVFVERLKTLYRYVRSTNGLARNTQLQQQEQRRQGVMNVSAPRNNHFCFSPSDTESIKATIRRILARDCAGCVGFQTMVELEQQGLLKRKGSSNEVLSTDTIAMETAGLVSDFMKEHLTAPEVMRWINLTVRNVNVGGRGTAHTCREGGAFSVVQKNENKERQPFAHVNSNINAPEKTPKPVPGPSEVIDLTGLVDDTESTPRNVARKPLGVKRKFEAGGDYSAFSNMDRRVRARHDGLAGPDSRLSLDLNPPSLPAGDQCNIVRNVNNGNNEGGEAPLHRRRTEAGCSSRIGEAPQQCGQGQATLHQFMGRNISGEENADRGVVAGDFINVTQCIQREAKPFASDKEPLSTPQTHMKENIPFNIHDCFFGKSMYKAFLPTFFPTHPGQPRLPHRTRRR